MSNLDNNALDNVLGGILAAADKERQASQSYKDLFEGSADVESLLRQTDRNMTRAVLDATKVLDVKFGYSEMPNDKRDEIFWLLMALPFLIRQTTKHIEKTQGMSCCVDKAYYHVANQIKEILGSSNE